MTISPNLGVIGAPQLGHFKDETPEGATTGPVDAVAEGLEAFTPVLAPHLVQNAVPSGSWVPHFWQYKLFTDFVYSGGYVALKFIP